MSRTVGLHSNIHRQKRNLHRCSFSERCMTFLSHPQRSEDHRYLVKTNITLWTHFGRGGVSRISFRGLDHTPSFSSSQLYTLLLFACLGVGSKRYLSVSYHPHPPSQTLSWGRQRKVAGEQRPHAPAVRGKKGARARVRQPSSTWRERHRTPSALAATAEAAERRHARARAARASRAAAGARCVPRAAASDGRPRRPSSRRTIPLPPSPDVVAVAAARSDAAVAAPGREGA